MSFKKYLSKITEYYYKNIVKTPELVFDFPEVFRKSKKMLVILPTDIKERKKILSKISIIKSEFKMFCITYIGVDIGKDELRILPEGSMSLSSENINLFAVPCHEILNRISKEAFDVSLDMNSVFDISSAICPLRAGVPLRFGLTSGYGYPFYNVGFWNYTFEDFLRFWKDVNGEFITK